MWNTRHVVPNFQGMFFDFRDGMKGNAVIKSVCVYACWFFFPQIMVTHGLALASWKVIDLCILPFQNGPWLQFLDLDSAR